MMKSFYLSLSLVIVYRSPLGGRWFWSILSDGFVWGKNVMREWRLGGCHAVFDSVVIRRRGGHGGLNDVFLLLSGVAETGHSAISPVTAGRGCAGCSGCPAPGWRCPASGGSPRRPGPAGRAGGPHGPVYRSLAPTWSVGRAVCRQTIVFHQALVVSCELPG